MSKKSLPRVLEPDTGLVHYGSHPIADAVTLCGLTDWLGVTKGQDTRASVSCYECKSIVDYVRNSRKDKTVG